MKMTEIRERYAAAGINEIRLRLDCVDFKLEESWDSEQIELDIRAEERDICEYGVRDGILAVRCRIENKWFNGSFNTTHITLRVPREKEFLSFRLKVGAGKADLLGAGLRCKNAELSSGAGKILAGSLYAEENICVDIGAGSVELMELKAQNLIAKCGMGSLKIHGEVAQNLTVDCGMGDCRLDLRGNEEDYNCEMSCGMGAVKMNGNSVGQIGGRQLRRKTDAAGTIRLSCGMGKVELNMM